MTQEKKQLLLKDLCARLYCGVICQVDDGAAGLNDGKLIEIDISKELVRFDADYYWDAYIDDIKPYLRPMSSITEEEKVQLSQYACIGEDLNGEFIDEVQRKDCAAYIDWLNKNHFDYRGLILKNLALEAPKGMYNIKMRCKKLGYREVPRSCHVLNRRKDYCKDLFVIDEKDKLL